MLGIQALGIQAGNQQNGVLGWCVAGFEAVVLGLFIIKEVLFLLFFVPKDPPSDPFDETFRLLNYIFKI